MTLKYVPVTNNNLTLASKIQFEIFPNESAIEHFLYTINNEIEYNKYFLVYNDNIIIGITGIYSNENIDETNSLWLGWFGVLERYRSKGYGKKILCDTIDMATKLSKKYPIKFFRLYTSERDDKLAICLYNKIMDTKEYYNNKEDINYDNTCLIYTKSLNNNEIELWNNKFLNLREIINEQEKGNKIVNSMEKDSMIIDTHSHMYNSEYLNAEEIIKECSKNNIKIILNGIDKKSNLEVLELSKKYDNVYAAIGYDHSVVDEISDDDIDLLENQIKDNKVTAIGEIGIDYYWVKDNKDKQKELFIKQIDLAIKYDLPIIVHSRDAVQDVYDILKNKNVKGSIHCYSGSTEMAKEFIKLGFYIGIDGPITFKNNKKQREMVKNIDINHVLVETDSPYLSPEPFRGEKNTSLNLKYIINQIAIECSLTYEEVKDITTNNAIRLFNLDI